MMRKIHDALELVRQAEGFTASEDPGRLHVSGRFGRAALDAWQAVADAHLSWLTIEFKDASKDHVAPKDGTEGAENTLWLTFSSPTDCPHLFTREGWLGFLHGSDAAISAATEVRLVFASASFETRAFTVQPWAEPPVAPSTQTTRKLREAGPRRQVRCQSPETMAPTHIEPWILVGPIQNDEASTIWQRVAAMKLAQSLPNELFQSADGLQASLVGQPPRRMELGDFSSCPPPFEMLQEVAKWIYLEGEDIEVRHTFLTAELAREWPPMTTFCAGLEGRLGGALESARLLYKAHLRSGSKDTLKTLSDLRKTLSEEVQKLLQQTRDLTGAVWRDVAIAIGAFAVRTGMDGAKYEETAWAFALIYVVVAVYITISFLITVAAYQRFLDIGETTRLKWRTKLYAFLDERDYQEMAETPVTDAIAAYRQAEERSRYVVAVVVVAMLVLGVIEADLIDFKSLAAWCKYGWDYFVSTVSYR